MTEELVGDSPALRDIRSLASTIATVSSTVLIRGEKGTGKTLLGRHIHRERRDADGPVVAANLEAVPGALVELYLFGWERGPFRTACPQSPSQFERASNGTLVLQNVELLELAIQAKLLRALREGQFERVRGVKPIKLDSIRLIATTRVDLESAVSAGRFCEELHYRLNVIPVRIPPLRDRSSDIPLLLQHFWKLLCERQGSTVSKPTLGAGVMNALINHPWPGNVRELQDTVHCLWNLAADRTIERADLPPAIQSRHS